MRNVKPFSLGIFLAVQPLCALVQFCFGFTLDTGLRGFGVEIQPWQEAFYAALGGMFFMSTVTPISWRLGLVTIPHYLLAAYSLFMPATIIWLAVFSPISPIQFEMTQLDPGITDSRAWAMSVYVRIARSAVLTPVYVLSFWYFYHYLLNRDNTQGTRARDVLAANA